MDKRVIRTKNSIKTAYMQLTLANEPGKLTVSDVAQKAGINRSTFYLHYADIASIEEDIDKEFAEVIEKCVEDFDITDVYKSIYNVFSFLTSALDREAVKKNYIISSTESKNVLLKLKRTIVEKAMQAITSAFPDSDASGLEIPLTYASAGIVDSYAQWSKTSGNTVSLETLIRQVSAITEYIIEDITVKRRV
ncbi:MAG: TetR/AcrR family transcriptional regulator [Clostridia bacterium]|nr:TetR/AcrR family transcriptional regulator [Clostridia bacterium]